jgi:activator of HSP90 ATPase
MKKKIKLSVTLQASPEVIYKAWLSSKEHAAFTGDEAKISSKKGGSFKAGKGYISGKNLELEQNKRIVQSWRAADFPEGAEDSRLELIFEKTGKGTKLTLLHSNIPESLADSYKEGWKEFYFTPMKKYFKGE